MCPYCNASRTPFQSDLYGMRSFSSLRVPQEKWEEHRMNHSYENVPVDDDNGFNYLRVVGFTEEINSVLRASNPEGYAYVEVGWSGLDNILSIGQRIEDKIHIPIHYWVLATGDGVILRVFGETAASTRAFQSKGQVVLTLLLPSEIEEFIEFNAAKTEFHLIDPEPSPFWGAYLAQRRADSQKVGQMFSGDSEENSWEFNDIESAVNTIIDSMHLGDEEAATMTACVIPLDRWYERDGDLNRVPETTVLARIYSPIRPAAVDIRLIFGWYPQLRNSEVYCLDISYCEHDPISWELSQSMPKPGDYDFDRFKPLMSVDTNPYYYRQWCACGHDDRSFDITAPEVNSLYQLLFGADRGIVVESLDLEETSRGGIRHVDMMQLFIASVGIRFRTSFENQVEDEFEMGENRCYGTGQCNARWLGENMRRVCEMDPIEGHGGSVYYEGPVEGRDERVEEYEIADEDHKYEYYADEGTNEFDDGPVSIWGWRQV